MTRESRWSLVVAVAAGVTAAVVVLVAGSPHDALLTGAVLIPCGVASVLAGIAIARSGRRLASVRRHLALGGAIAVGQLLVVVALFAALMQVRGHDAAMIALAVVYAGLVAVLATRLVARAVLGDIASLRAALHAVGEGERAPDLPADGRDELAGLADEVRAMARRLEVEEVARRQLIAAVSHDLRTPITSLQLLAEAVDDEIVDPGTRREYLSRLRTHLRALSGLIDDLFELSRIESGDIRWTLERVALGELVHETVDAMRPQADARSVAVRAEVPSGLLAAADPERLQRVLFNLIQNAIRHTPADGSVVVRASAGPDGPEVAVVDTGEGIPAAERALVFDAFYRAGHDASRGDDGAGLGLAIARAIVEAHGGQIWLEDATAGAHVRFSLRSA
ncbi:MAG TPA: HAMP domain-containing sensor histidine kinase [Solirubrobacteraceae bacterium]